MYQGKDNLICRAHMFLSNLKLTFQSMWMYHQYKYWALHTSLWHQEGSFSHLLLKSFYWMRQIWYITPTNKEKYHYKRKVWVFNQSWFHSPVNVAVTVSDDKIWQPMKTFTLSSTLALCYMSQVKCSSSSTLFNHVYIHLSFCQIGTSLQFNFSSSSSGFRVENV